MLNPKIQGYGKQSCGCITGPQTVNVRCEKHTIPKPPPPKGIGIQDISFSFKISSYNTEKY